MKRGRLFVGSSGWSYDHWKGLFYPEKLPKARRFSYYAERFRTVEINYSFYRLPSEKTIERWKEGTPEGFRFALKASRWITHRKRLVNVEEPLDRFLHVVSGLGERLGPVLYQLPPSMGFDPARLEAFLKILPEDILHAVEFRNDGWNREETFRLLRDSGVGYCILSAPGLECRLEATAGFSYVRFHGIRDWYRYNYTEEDLSWWAAKLRAFLIEGKDVYAFFNNDFLAYAPRNALRLKELVELKPKIDCNLLPPRH